jgi:hypothetical protein
VPKGFNTILTALKGGVLNPSGTNKKIGIAISFNPNSWQLEEGRTIPANTIYIFISDSK